MNSFDLSDSEDELEMRRQAKRRKQARIRKALLEDDKIGKIAADPKKAAFLSAIEDVEGEAEEGISFLDEEVDVLFPEYESQSQTPGGSQDVEMADVATTVVQSGDAEKGKVNPSHPLRKQLHGRAREKASLQKLRSTLSFLSETKNGEDSDLSLTSGDEADSDLEGSKGQRKENERPRIIDRVEQKRTLTTKSTASLQPSLAFTTTATTSTSTTARLALLRKATTTSSASFSTEREAAELADKGAFKKASSKASINFHNREVRRKEVVERKGRTGKKVIKEVGGGGMVRKGVLKGLDKGGFE
jgi:mediator of replication checkpoint protein 1